MAVNGKFHDPDFRVPRRPLAPHRIYHFNVVYNHGTGSDSRSQVQDSVLALRVTQTLVSRLELKGYVNSYYHDRDFRCLNTMDTELDRVLRGSSVTILILTPGFLSKFRQLYFSSDSFYRLVGEPRSVRRLLCLGVGVVRSQVPPELTADDVLYFGRDWEVDIFMWDRIDRTVDTLYACSYSPKIKLCTIHDECIIKPREYVRDQYQTGHEKNPTINHDLDFTSVTNSTRSDLFVAKRGTIDSEHLPTEQYRFNEISARTNVNKDLDLQYKDISEGPLAKSQTQNATLDISKKRSSTNTFEARTCSGYSCSPLGDFEKTSREISTKLTFGHVCKPVQDKQSSQPCSCRKSDGLSRKRSHGRLDYGHFSRNGETGGNLYKDQREISHHDKLNATCTCRKIKDFQYGSSGLRSEYNRMFSDQVFNDYLDFENKKDSHTKQNGQLLGSINADHESDRLCRSSDDLNRWTCADTWNKWTQETSLKKLDRVPFSRRITDDLNYTLANTFTRTGDKHEDLVNNGLSKYVSIAPSIQSLETSKKGANFEFKYNKWTTGENTEWSSTNNFSRSLSEDMLSSRLDAATKHTATGNQQIDKKQYTQEFDNRNSSSSSYLGFKSYTETLSNINRNLMKPKGTLGDEGWDKCRCKNLTKREGDEKTNIRRQKQLSEVVHCNPTSESPTNTYTFDGYDTKSRCARYRVRHYDKLTSTESTGYIYNPSSNIHWDSTHSHQTYTDTDKDYFTQDSFELYTRDDFEYPVRDNDLDFLMSPTKLERLNLQHNSTPTDSHHVFPSALFEENKRTLNEHSSLPHDTRSLADHLLKTDFQSDKIFGIESLDKQYRDIGTEGLQYHNRYHGNGMEDDQHESWDTPIHLNKTRDSDQRRESDTEVKYNTSPFFIPENTNYLHERQDVQSIRSGSLNQNQIQVGPTENLSSKTDFETVNGETVREATENIVAARIAVDMKKEPALQSFFLSIKPRTGFDLQEDSNLKQTEGGLNRFQISTEISQTKTVASADDNTPAVPDPDLFSTPQYVLEGTCSEKADEASKSKINNSSEVFDVLINNTDKVSTPVNVISRERVAHSSRSYRESRATKLEPPSWPSASLNVEEIQTSFHAEDAVVRNGRQAISQVVHTNIDLTSRSGEWSPEHVVNSEEIDQLSTCNVVTELCQNGGNKMCGENTTIPFEITGEVIRGTTETTEINDVNAKTKELQGIERTEKINNDIGRSVNQKNDVLEEINLEITRSNELGFGNTKSDQIHSDIAKAEDVSVGTLKRDEINPNTVFKKEDNIRDTVEAEVIQGDIVKTEEINSDNIKSEKINQSILKTKEINNDYVKTEKTHKVIVKSELNDRDIVKTEERNQDIVKTEESNQDIVETEESNQDIVKTEKSNQDIVKTEESNQDIVETEESNQDIVKTGEINQDIVKTEKSNQDIVKTKESNQDIVKTEESNQDIVKTGEINQDIVKTGEINQDIVKTEKSNQDIVTTEESNQDIVTKAERNQDIVKTEEIIQNIVKTKESNQDIVKTGERNQDIVKRGEINQAFVKREELNQEIVKTGEINSDNSKTEIINTDIVKTNEINQNIVKSVEINGDIVKTDNVNSDRVKTMEIDQDIVKAEETIQDIVKTDEINSKIAKKEKINHDKIKTEKINQGIVNTKQINRGIVNTEKIFSKSAAPITESKQLMEVSEESIYPTLNDEEINNETQWSRIASGHAEPLSGLTEKTVNTEHNIAVEFAVTQGCSPETVSIQGFGQDDPSRETIHGENMTEDNSPDLETLEGDHLENETVVMKEGKTTQQDKNMNVAISDGINVENLDIATLNEDMTLGYLIVGNVTEKAENLIYDFNVEIATAGINLGSMTAGNTVLGFRNFENADLINTATENDNLTVINVDSSLKNMTGDKSLKPMSLENLNHENKTEAKSLEIMSVDNPILEHETEAKSLEIMAVENPILEHETEDKSLEIMSVENPILEHETEDKSLEIIAVENPTLEHETEDKSLEIMVVEKPILEHETEDKSLEIMAVEKPIVEHETEDKSLEIMAVEKPILEHETEDKSLEIMAVEKPIVEHETEDTSLEIMAVENPILEHETEDKSLEIMSVENPTLEHETEDTSLEIMAAENPILEHETEDTSLEIIAVENPTLEHETEDKSLEIMAVENPILEHETEDTSLEIIAVENPTLEHETEDKSLKIMAVENPIPEHETEDKSLEIISVENPTLEHETEDQSLEIMSVENPTLELETEDKSLEIMSVENPTLEHETEDTSLEIMAVEKPTLELETENKILEIMAVENPTLEHETEDKSLEIMSVENPILEHETEDKSLEIMAVKNPTLEHETEDKSLEIMAVENPIREHETEDKSIEIMAAKKPILEHETEDKSLEIMAVEKPIVEHETEDTSLEILAVEKTILEHETQGTSLEKMAVKKPILEHEIGDDENETNQTIKTSKATDNNFLEVTTVETNQDYIGSKDIIQNIESSEVDIEKKLQICTATAESGNVETDKREALNHMTLKETIHDFVEDNEAIEREDITNEILPRSHNVVFTEEDGSDRSIRDTVSLHNELTSFSLVDTIATLSPVKIKASDEDILDPSGGNESQNKVLRDDILLFYVDGAGGMIGEPMEANSSFVCAMDSTDTVDGPGGNFVPCWTGEMGNTSVDGEDATLVSLLPDKKMNALGSSTETITACDRSKHSYNEVEHSPVSNVCSVHDNSEVEHSPVSNVSSVHENSEVEHSPVSNISSVNDNSEAEHSPVSNISSVHDNSEVEHSPVSNICSVHDNSEVEHSPVSNISSVHDNSEVEHSSVSIISSVHDNSEVEHSSVSNISSVHDNSEVEHSPVSNIFSVHNNNEVEHSSVSNISSYYEDMVKPIQETELHIEFLSGSHSDSLKPNIVDYGQCQNVAGLDNIVDVGLTKRTETVPSDVENSEAGACLTLGVSLGHEMSYETEQDLKVFAKSANGDGSLAAVTCELTRQDPHSRLHTTVQKVNERKQGKNSINVTQQTSKTFFEFYEGLPHEFQPRLNETRNKADELDLGALASSKEKQELELVVGEILIMSSEPNINNLRTDSSLSGKEDILTENIKWKHTKMRALTKESKLGLNQNLYAEHTEIRTLSTDQVDGLESGTILVGSGTSSGDQLLINAGSELTDLTCRNSRGCCGEATGDEAKGDEATGDGATGDEATGDEAGIADVSYTSIEADEDFDAGDMADDQSVKTRDKCKAKGWILPVYKGVCHSLTNPEMPFMG